MVSAVLGGLLYGWTLRKAVSEKALPHGIFPDAVRRMPSSAVRFVDTRSDAEYDSGHPDGAVRLRNGDWKSLIPKFYDAWVPGETVVVYGRARSDEPAAIAHRLREESGIREVFFLQGIWEECR